MTSSAELTIVDPPPSMIHRVVDFKNNLRAEKVYTTKEAALHLRLSASTVKRLVSEGKLESFTPYVGARRFTESQLARFIDRASRDNATGGPR